MAPLIQAGLVSSLIAALTVSEATWAQSKKEAVEVRSSAQRTAPSSPSKGGRASAPIVGESSKSRAARRVSGIAPAPDPAPATPDLSIPFEKITLDNGLELILHRDSTLPLVAVSVWYHVGPVNEPPKRSGFAHLFEHLMFAGSRDVGSHFDPLLESIGATNVNGTTNWDRTNYFETVPREYLELALWIESDRMGFLIDGISQKALDIQRDVVKNERRQSFENAPYGPSSLAMMDTLFPEGHPYHGAVIGSMQDLSAATFDDVKSFYKDYYAPSNATLALAGDFEPSQAKAWAHKYFGTLRKLPRPQTPVRASSPISATHLNIDEPVQVAKVAFGWVTPGAYQAESAPLELAAEVLAGGKASRLYRSLVVEQKIAVDVDASADDNKLGTLFTIDASAASGVATKRLEDALDAEIVRLHHSPPSDSELHRAKRHVLLSLVRDLQSLNGHGGESGRLGVLQRFNHYWGRPDAMRDWYQQVWNVTSHDISEASGRWLDTAHRVTVVTRPSQEVKQP